MGPIAVLWHPYDGYLHLVPRILVDAAVAVAPIDLYAITVNALSCCVLGAVCGLVFLLSGPFLRHWPLQVVLALVPALLPAATIEIAGNTANLHWFLLFLAPWVFAYPTRSWWTAAALAIAAGFVTATEIQAALFLPLLLLQLRNRRAIPVVVIAVAGIAAQVLVTLTHPRDKPGGITSIIDVIAGYLAQPVGVSWNSSAPAVGSAIQGVGWWVVVVPGAILLGVIVGAILRAPWLQKWMLAAIVVGSVAVWSGALLLNRTDRTNWTTYTSKDWAEVNTFRYAAAASMFLLAAIVVAADVLIARGPVVLRVIGSVLVVLVVLTGVLNADTPARRENGPIWSRQVHNVQQVCAADPARSMQISASPALPAWRANVPCALVNTR